MRREIFFIAMSWPFALHARNCSLDWCTDFYSESQRAARCSPCAEGYYCPTFTPPSAGHETPISSNPFPSSATPCPASPAGLCPEGSTGSCLVDEYLSYAKAYSCIAEPDQARWTRLYTAVNSTETRILQPAAYRVDIYRDEGASPAAASRVVALSAQGTAILDGAGGTFSISGVDGSLDINSGVETPGILSVDIGFDASGALQPNSVAVFRLD